MKITLKIWSVFLLAVMTAGCPGSSGGEKRCGPPQVDAGQDLTKRVGEVVVLRASVKLPPEDLQLCIDEKNKIVYRWEQVGGPEVQLEGKDQANASFTPTTAGSYSFRCQATYPVTAVNPEAQVSQWDTVRVEVEAAPCPPPVASAGNDQFLSTTAGQPVVVTLDGSQSRAATNPGCEGISISTFHWTQTSGPTVTIQNANQATATVELSEFGTYEFSLEIKDSGGSEGRQDTASDSVMITLEEKSPCEQDLVVTVKDAVTGQTLSGAHVKVVDAEGHEHNADTGANGKASFSSLAKGPRRSITVFSDERVPALAGSGERPKYEVTTLLEHCAAVVTIPLKLSGSGQKAAKAGTISGKIPQNLWNLLPHSYRCTKSCGSDSDCDAEYYCEKEENTCKGYCTPRSLLPFFSLGGGEISGQFRVAMLFPLYSTDSFGRFPVVKLFASPPTAGAILPGNLTTDDIFLNGLATSLGLDPYGNQCDSVSECPNNVDWVCDYEVRRCRDKHPLRNFKLSVPAGNNTPVVLLLGIMDVSLLDLMPILLPFLEGGSATDFELPGFMSAFLMSTLYACPIKVNVAENQNTDISSALAALSASDCWNVNYQQLEAVLPVPDPNAVNPGNTCDPQNDQCPTIRPDLKCLASPWNASEYYCFIPLYKVAVRSNDKITLKTPQSGFQPWDEAADARLRSNLPATAQHEVKCDADGNGVPETCLDQNGQPAPKYCDLSVDKNNTDCAFTFGLALAALDFGEGNAIFGRPGRVIIGFNFNRTYNLFRSEVDFLVPPRSNQLAGVEVSMTQLFFRNIKNYSDFTYFQLPGKSTASVSSNSPVVSELQLPNFLAPPVGSQMPDAGMDVKVAFIVKDPLADCGSLVIDKTYAMACVFNQAENTQNLPSTPTEPALKDLALHGLVMGRVDRVTAGEYIDVLVDNLWRIYAPAGVEQFNLPAGVTPFASGQEIQLTFWGSGFPSNFDYDLFPNQQVLSGETLQCEDSWFLKVP